VLYQVIRAASLVAGPALLATSTFFWNDEGRYGTVGGTLAVVASWIWVLGLLFLWSVVRARYPRWGSCGPVLLALGTAGGVAFGVQGFLEAAFGLSAEESLDALAAYPWEAYVVYWLAGPAFPISMVLLGLSLARGRLVPVWSALMLALGGVAFPASRITRIEAIGHLADVVLLVPSIYLAWFLLQTVRSARSIRELG